MNPVRKHSRKREAMLRALRASHEHPSADDVYRALREEYPDLSLGTVYRNLALFKETGQIISVGTVDGQERFDARTHSHAHFVCQDCGRVVDLPESALSLEEGLLAAASAQIPGKVTGYALTFTGRCPSCAGGDSSESPAD